MKKYPPDSIEQMTWDNILIKGWFVDANFFNMVKMFETQCGAEKKHLVRRMPIFNRHFASGCRRFVAAYLPELSTKLWDGMERKDILFYLLSSNMDILKRPIDERKNRRELSEIKKSENINEQVKYGRKISRYFYAKNLRSNQWSVVK